MKTLRVTLVILLLSLGLALVACDQVATPNPDNPNAPTEPNEPDPKTSDGLEQLIASADASGKLSATVSFETDETMVSSFMTADGSTIKFVQASFNLLSKEGAPFKALGVITLGKDSALKEGDTSFSTKGEFVFAGQVETVNGLKVVRANSSLVDTDKQKHQYPVALLMLRSRDSFTEPELKTSFKGSAAISIANGDLGSGRIMAPAQLSEQPWGSFTFTGKNDDGSEFLGLGLADLSKVQVQESTAEFDFVAQNLATSYGNAYQLIGKLQSPEGAPLFFDEADAFALTLSLKSTSPSNPDDPGSDDGFEELTEGLADDTTVGATLNYKVSPLETSLRTTRVDTVAAEYLLTTERGNTLKALAIMRLPDELTKLSDDEIFASIENETVDFKGRLIALEDMKVLLGTADVNMRVEDTVFSSQLSLVAFPSSLKLNTQVNKDLTSSAVSLNLGTNGIFSFLAQTNDSNFVGLGLGFDKDAPVDADKARLDFFTEPVGTSAGSAGEARGFLTFEEKKVLPIVALTVGFETKQEAKTVLVCSDCEEDVVSVLTKAEQSIIDWEKVTEVASGIPNWIKGKEPVPYGKEPSCESRYALFLEASYGASLYAGYYFELKAGSQFLSSGHSSGVKIFEAGSKEHDTIKAYFLNAGDASYAVAETILQDIDELACFDKKGVR